MAVTTSTPLDAARIKLDFPILAKPVHGKPLVYLDSAASSQKPRTVIDAIVDVYENSYAAVHRAVYALGETATEQYEAARDKVGALLNAYSRREIVFVRSATEGINLVAYAYGDKFIGAGRRDRRDRDGAPLQPRPVADGRPTHRCDAALRRADRRRPARSRVARGARRRREREARGCDARLELARDGQRHPGDRGLGARARRGHGLRRRPGGAAPPRRCARARVRLLRDLGPQDVRPRRRRPVGSGGALRADGPVHDGRRTDRQGRARRHDLERASLQVRAGRPAAGRGGRVRRGDRLRDRHRPRGHPRARADADELRLGCARRRCPA